MTDAATNRFPHIDVRSEVIDGSVDWKEYVRKLAGER
jgi:hypothetical protein